MRDWLEYAVAWSILKFLGLLPRPAARAVASSITRALLILMPRLRRTSATNLDIAFPKWPESERSRTVRAMTRSLGWMAAEFAHFSRLNSGNIQQLVVIDGAENFAEAQRRGKGVIFLTAHMSAWELAPFAHALYGHPLAFLARAIENRRVNALVNRYRCLSGNQPIEKNDSARTTLRILREGGTVGILADQNTAVEEGVFVDFFGIPAATTTGLARIALRTGAAVVPGFLSWDGENRKYRLRFDPAVALQQTGNEAEDIRENTRLCNQVLENCIRAHPGEWLWIHKRWKNRPPGEPPLYPD